MATCKMKDINFYMCGYLYNERCKMICVATCKMRDLKYVWLPV